MGIGTLNEGPLHQALKAHYASSLAGRVAVEQNVDGFVADVVANRTLYEIQTGSFSGLRRKLDHLLDQNRLVLIYPIPAVCHIVKLAQDPDEPPGRRKSPKRGHVRDVLNELVYVPTLLDHPNLELEVVMVEIDEVRQHDPKRVRRRKGWRVLHRSLVNIVATHRFVDMPSLLALLDEPLPDEFGSADLGARLGGARHLGQKMAYCMRHAGYFEICGKEGNALRYSWRDNPD